MYLTLEKITGFECSDSAILVCDLEGRTLYEFKNEKGARIVFNLPVGDWHTTNEINELKRPLRYVLPTLPKPHKSIKMVELNFEVKENPNKCSIDVKTGNVIIDPSIMAQSIPFCTFVLCHEIGHFYYKGGIGEHLCDCFSAVQMLKNGFNPSQIYLAQEFCLSENSIKRKDYLFNFLKRHKYYE